MGYKRRLQRCKEKYNKSGEFDWNKIIELGAEADRKIDHLLTAHIVPLVDDDATKEQSHE